MYPGICVRLVGRVWQAALCECLCARTGTCVLFHYVLLSARRMSSASRLRLLERQQRKKKKSHLEMNTNMLFCDPPASLKTQPDATQGAHTSQPASQRRGHIINCFFPSPKPGQRKIVVKIVKWHEARKKKTSTEMTEVPCCGLLKHRV